MACHSHESVRRPDYSLASSCRGTMALLKHLPTPGQPALMSSRKKQTSVWMQCAAFLYLHTTLCAITCQGRGLVL